MTADLQPAFTRQQQHRYMRQGSRAVEGWLETCDKYLIASLAALQSETGIGGGLCEIGVHHGKLFLLLYLHLHEGETAVAVDLFEDQTRNIDNSGRGDRALFQHNLARHAGSDRRLHIIAGDSTALDPATITTAAGRIRLFSIDGGHTAAITQSDLALADACLADDGIVILDDYFNPSWPGVSEGALAYFQSAPRDLVPFAIGINKLFFCRPGRAEFYRRNLRARRHECFESSSEFLGHEVAVFAGYDSFSHLVALTRLGVLSPALRAARGVRRHLLDRLAYHVCHGFSR